MKGIQRERQEAKDDADDSATRGIAFAQRAETAEALVAQWEYFNQRYPPADKAANEKHLGQAPAESFFAQQPWTIPGVESHDLPPGRQMFNMDNNNPSTQYVTTSDAAETARSQLPTVREDAFKTSGANLPRRQLPGPQTGGPMGGAQSKGPLNGSLLGPLAQMQAAEAYKDGRNPYIHPMNTPSNSKNPIPAQDLSQEEINECLITGNPAHIAQLNQKHNYGIDHRIATPFGKLNDRGERGLSGRELQMAQDMAEMKRMFGHICGQPIPSLSESIAAYLPEDVANQKHSVF